MYQELYLSQLGDLEKKSKKERVEDGVERYYGEIIIL